VVADLVLQAIKQVAENFSRPIAERRNKALNQVAGPLAVKRFIPLFDQTDPPVVALGEACSRSVIGFT
jgi:hypothetical protein